MKFSQAFILSTLIASSLAQAQSNPEHFVISDRNLPHDGSVCDPVVIAANIKKLQKVLSTSGLSETRTPAVPNCYHLPCGETLAASIKEHCLKAEKLAEIADLLR